MIMVNGFIAFLPHRRTVSLQYSVATFLVSGKIDDSHTSRRSIAARTAAVEALSSLFRRQNSVSVFVMGGGNDDLPLSEVVLFGTQDDVAEVERIISKA